MFKKVVSFVIRKRDVIAVIDSIASYGIVTIAIAPSKGVESYAVMIECDKNNLQNCLSKLMELSERRVTIRKLDVTTKI